MALDIASMIQPASVVAEHCKILLFGAPSSGKTTLLASAPKPLIVDTEQGTVTLATNPVFRDTPVIRVSTIEGMKDLIRFLDTSAGDQFDTIGVDTLTELQKLFLDSIIEESAKGKHGDAYTVPDGGYNKNNMYARSVISDLLELKKHIVFTTHTQLIEINGIKKTAPLLTPKVLENVMGLMDGVFYLQVKQVRDESSPSPTAMKKVRELQTLQTPLVECKNRLGLSDFITDPTMEQILNAHKKAAQAGTQMGTPVPTIKPTGNTVPTPPRPQTSNALGLNI